MIEKITWHLDEPIADPSAISTYLISKEARKSGIKVLLSGMGADEVFQDTGLILLQEFQIPILIYLKFYGLILKD